MRFIGIRTGVLVALTLIGLLGGAPAAQAAPALQLSNSTGLTVGQTITVTLDGLPANMAAVAVGQCKPQITGPGDCHLPGSVLGAADGQGHWQSNGGKQEITLVANVGGTDCAAAPGACTISVTSLTNATEILASVALTFGATVEQPTPTVTATNAADSDSNTGMVIGIVVGVLVIAAVAVTVVVRRRSRSN